jgi:predicted HTH domain antitoxin
MSPEEQLVDALVQCQRKKVSIERIAKILAVVFDYKADVLADEIIKIKK